MDLQKYYKRIIKYRRWIAGCLAGGLALNKSLCLIFPNTFSMPLYADVDIDNFSFEHVAWLMRNTKEDLNVTDHIFPFISTQFNCHSAGCLGSFKWKNTPVLGIPKLYLCSNILEIEALQIRLDSTKRFVDTEGGPNELAFLESLVFSDSAQKFDVARQIFALKSNIFLINLLISPIFVLLGYFICFHGVKLLFSSGKPVVLQRILQWQILGVVLTWFGCKLAKNVFSYYTERSLDRKAASVSKEYASGAIEFYENLKKSNKALRVLLGKKGERNYTEDGDVSSYFFAFRTEPSYTKRLEYLNATVNSFEAK